MKIVLVKSTVVILSYFIAIFAATYFGLLYDYLFQSGGSFIGDPDTVNWIMGFVPAVVFVLTLLMHAQGGRHVWWWNIVALAPVILIAIVIDSSHIYIPIILGLIAWGFGTMANKALQKLAPSFMAKIS